MRKLAVVLMVAALAPVGYALAQGEGLQWAYPTNPPPGAPNADNAPIPKTISQNQIVGSYTGLPTMPEVVMKGKPLPCMQCHLGNGNGHPESSDISGLPVNYIIEQVHAFAKEQRVDQRTTRMVAVSKIIGEEDLLAAAKYYAAIPRARQKIFDTVIATEAPKGEFTFGTGSYRNHAPEGGNEPIPVGHIIQVPKNDDLVRARDMNLGTFIQYVRPEDMALGQKVAMTGDNGRITKCATCHGADFRGVGDVPRLAGRQSLYLIRALNDMKTGANKNPAAAAMQPVVSKMTDQDIVGVAAYLASKEP